MFQIITVLSLFISSVALAHGEDKYGPHGGFVRMPSNYHTEVVLENKNTLKIYLLDINWKNPSVLNSSVQLLHKAKKNTPAQCEIKQDHYLCSFRSSLNLTKKGLLVLNSQREGQKGIEVSYPLPLKLEKAAPMPGSSNGHGGHH